jgi:hypothetical protein
LGLGFSYSFRRSAPRGSGRSRGERDTRCVWREKKDTEERKEEEEEEEGLFKANAVN